MLAAETEAIPGALSEPDGTAKDEAWTTPVGETAGETAPPPALTAETALALATTGFISSGLTATLEVFPEVLVLALAVLVLLDA